MLVISDEDPGINYIIFFRHANVQSTYYVLNLNILYTKRDVEKLYTMKERYTMILNVVFEKSIIGLTYFSCHMPLRKIKD